MHLNFKFSALRRERGELVVGLFRFSAYTAVFRIILMGNRLDLDLYDASLFVDLSVTLEDIVTIRD